ncbi:heme A synthase [Meridianimarinicoccus aquatilis]|uniref:Heme A synthase n=1 Tax=Meridianimarinicoccus aquatilis TaxID=2552766 RepID=A0A4R6B5B2_9RHOB|nr:heme A synthase [Fluviibacterium aquatile]TDL91218.1 heme A synthase [Fluviibacterium aquatile]
MSQKNRKLFEEVDAPTAAPATTKGGLIDRRGSGARRGVRLWLMVLFVMVVTMIAVGGLTRLTDSGLSITEWRPVTGAVPPLSAKAWQSEFDKYREIPEYELQNKGMTLGEFKVIYWWEWGHRQLGRAIGLVWALGFAGFALARKIPPGWSGRLFLIGGLGGLQGAIGWWMVSSGLGSGMVDVASYRLAIHLGLAFVILGFIAWYVFLLGRSEPELMTARRGKDLKLFNMSTGLMHLAFVQILLGALVAGIDAGRSFTDWPLMGGQVFPASAFVIEPFWRNFFENPGLVQFIHRMTAYVVLAFGVVVWLRGRRSANRGSVLAFNMMAAALAVQIVLGIATVYHAAPWHLAIGHQFLAVVLWVTIVRARFLSMYPASQSVRG